MGRRRVLQTALATFFIGLSGIALLARGLTSEAVPESPQLEPAADDGATPTAPAPRPRPTSKNKSGLYAMKGPTNTAPLGAPLARMTPQSGVLYSRGLVGTGRGGGGIGAAGYGQGSASIPGPRDRAERSMKRASAEATSTFGVDVDTASSSYVRRHLNARELPSPVDVRIEEMINYFDYGYDLPSGSTPFFAHTEVGPSPWNPGRKLLHVGIQANEVGAAEIPARNLVFLVDVSGSMSSADRLPLLKQALVLLVPKLRPEDTVSIVVYAGSSGVVLKPTAGDHQGAILDALARLESGGATAGEAGLRQAYALAEQSFVPGGVNRVLLATDGDFNVGIHDLDELTRLISQKKESGVYLSVLRFGDSATSDPLMEQLADKGNGNYAYIDRLSEAHKVLVEEAAATLIPVADDVKIQIEFSPDTVESYRLVGYDNRRLANADFANDQKDAGDIGSGQSVTALYEFKPRTSTSEGDLLSTLRVRYKAPGKARSRLVEQGVSYTDTALPATSSAYRFSAAVAEYGQLLRGDSLPEGSFAQVLELAQDALDNDPLCLRQEFLALARRAGELRGEVDIPALRVGCEPTELGSRVAPRQRKSSLQTHFAPFDSAGGSQRSMAQALRRLPLWACMLPALLGGLLFGSRRRSTAY